MKHNYLNKINDTFAQRIFLSLLLTVLGVNANAQQQRIISTDAGSTDVLIALGNGTDLVGIDITSQLPKTLKVPKLGYHRSLSAEGILSLNPDMIIGSENMGPPNTVAAIKKAQLTLLQLPTARNEHTLKDNIKAISDLIDKQAQAEPLLNHINQAMALVNQRQLAVDTSVVFLLQMDGRGLRLAGTGTTGNDIISLLGGKNLGHHNGYQSVSAEALLNLEPDVIIVASRDMSRSPIELLLQHFPLLQLTPAGQQQRIVAVDGRLLVAGISLAAIDALADVAKKLHQTRAL